MINIADTVISFKSQNKLDVGIYQILDTQTYILLFLVIMILINIVVLI